MGFLLMIGSIVIGIALIILGISNRKSSFWYNILTVLGIALVAYGVYIVCYLLLT